MAFVVEDGTIVEGANSVVSFDDWTAFFEFHPYGAACRALTENEAQPYMVTATREVLSSFTFKGGQSSITQSLKFPRIGILLPSDYQGVEVYKLGDENITGTAYLELPASPLPKALKDGVLEYCRFLKTKDRSVTTDTAQVKRQKVDVIEREFFEGGAPDMIPESVQRLLAELTLSEPNKSVGRGGYIITSRAG